MTKNAHDTCTTAASSDADDDASALQQRIEQIEQRINAALRPKSRTTTVLSQEAYDWAHHITNNRAVPKTPATFAIASFTLAFAGHQRIDGSNLAMDISRASRLGGVDYADAQDAFEFFCDAGYLRIVNTYGGPQIDGLARPLITSCVMTMPSDQKRAIIPVADTALN